MPRESLEALRKQLAQERQEHEGVVQGLRRDMNALQTIHGQDQAEIARLRAIMLVLKSALEMAER
jgi:hypothetical protein